MSGTKAACPVTEEDTADPNEANFGNFIGSTRGDALSKCLYVFVYSTQKVTGTLIGTRSSKYNNTTE